MKTIEIKNKIIYLDDEDAELEVERLTKIIEEFQKKEYIILKHDNNYYKCYKLEKI